MGDRGGRMSSRAVEPAASRLLSVEELHARLREVGEQRYHHQHPFHLLLHEDNLTRGQLQAWVLNRYYYQSRIPLKDAIILSRSDDPSFRRAWRKRVLDHDGENSPEGGIERWIRLAEATGLPRDLITLRMGALRRHYPWLSGGLDYFEARLDQAPADAQFAFQFVADHARTYAEQEKAINALREKCEILWAQLDALYYAYVQPGWPPPGAFRPGE